MIRESVLHMAKCVTIEVTKTTFSQNVDPVTVMDLTQKGLERPKESSLENVASVVTRKWTVLNMAKDLIVQIQTQKECRI